MVPSCRTISEGLLIQNASISPNSTTICQSASDPSRNRTRRRRSERGSSPIERVREGALPRVAASDISVLLLARQQLVDDLVVEVLVDGALHQLGQVPARARDRHLVVARDPPRALAEDQDAVAEQDRLCRV